jgi:UDP-N-acetylmuramyl tripeptide synthase
MSCFLRPALVTALLLLLSLQTIAFGDDTKPKSIDSDLVAADQLYRAGKFADAETSYQALLKKSPRLVSAQVGLVRSMLRRSMKHGRL